MDFIASVYPLNHTFCQTQDLFHWISFTTFSSSGTHRKTKTDNHWHTPVDNLEFPIHFTCMFLDCGRYLENVERTNADPERKCKLQTEKAPGLGIEPVAQLLWGDSANRCLTFCTCCRRIHVPAENPNPEPLQSFECKGSNGSINHPCLLIER